ncbi:unnamed protein product [Agarophyton chilense]
MKRRDSSGQQPARRQHQHATPGRKAEPELRVPMLVLGFTVGASLLFLWYLGIFSSSTWPQTPAISHVKTAFDRSTFQLAVDEAQEQKPIFAIFYSKHCVACIRIKTPFVRVAQYFQHAAPFYAIDVIDDGNRHYVSQFGIKHVPYLLAITGKGDESHTLHKGKSSYAALHNFVKTNLPAA